MKYFLCAVLFCGALMAEGLQVCPPVLNPDSTQVAPDCPALTNSIIVTPGASQWFAWSNDNPNPPVPGFGLETGDGDYNDGNVEVDISASHDAMMTWLSSNSNWTNEVSAFGSPQFVSASSPGPVDLGTFGVGSEIILELFAADGNTYYSGDPLRNGGYSHFAIWGPDPTDESPAPEPNTIAMLGAGLACLGLARSRYKQRQ